MQLVSSKCLPDVRLPDLSPELGKEWEINVRGPGIKIMEGELYGVMLYF